MTEIYIVVRRKILSQISFFLVVTFSLLCLFSTLKFLNKHLKLLDLDRLSENEKRKNDLLDEIGIGSDLDVWVTVLIGSRIGVLGLECCLHASCDGVVKMGLLLYGFLMTGL